MQETDKYFLNTKKIISKTKNYPKKVKGVTFTLKDFMGEDSPVFDVIRKQKSERAAGKKGKQLYYCVIYLAPGDYHGYHSPATWSVKERVHFPGIYFLSYLLKMTHKFFLKDIYFRSLLLL